MNKNTILFAFFTFLLTANVYSQNRRCHSGNHRDENYENSGYFNNLEIALRNPDLVIELDLSNQRLSELPFNISYLKNLKILNLSSNNLKELSISITYLENLEVLILDNNYLTDLNSSFGYFKNLRELSLKYNNLNSLSSSLGYLKSLEFLDLTGNNLNDLSNNLSYLTKLEVLIVDDNPLILPQSLSYCKNLKYVYCRNTKVTALPSWVRDYSNIQSIYY